MIHLILREAYANLTVRESGIGFKKKIGKEFDPARMMKQAAQGMLYTDTRAEVSITRLIVARKPGKLMPHTHALHGHFMASKHSADFETRNLFSIARNNHGDYLLEIPEKPRNVQVALEFLKWLDENMLTVPVGAASVEVEP